MTNQAGIGYDFLGGQQAISANDAGYNRDARNFRNTLTITDVAGPDGKIDPRVKAFEIMIHELNEGLGRVWGIARMPSPLYPFSDLGRVSVSTLDTSEMGQVILPTLLYEPGNTSPTTGVFCHCNIFDRLVMGIGKTANLSLWKETSQTDSTVIAITYNPAAGAANIASLGAHQIGGATRPLNLFIGKEGANAVEVLSDVVTGGPAVYGSMNALTQRCWGILTSPINVANPGGSTLLIYANNNIYTLGCEQAVGTAPTVASTNINNGGYMIDVIELKTRVPRAYLVIPEIDTGFSMLTAGSETPGRVWSVNLEGTDPQPLFFPMKNIYYACRWQDTIVASDGLSIFFHDGTDATSLNWPGERPTDTQVAWRCNGMWSVGADLYILVTQQRAGNALVNVEKYKPETGGWDTVIQVTSATSATESGAVDAVGWLLGTAFVMRAGGSLPFSRQTGFLHLIHYVTTTITFSRFFRPPPDRNLFFHYNQNGASSAYSKEFVATGQLRSAAMLIEGLEGLPCVLEEIRCMADIAAGGAVAGTEATWQLDVASQVLQGGQAQGGYLVFTNNLLAKFTGADPYQRMFKFFETNDAPFTRLYYNLALNQGTGGTGPTFKNLNGVPFAIRGLCFLDGVVRSPQDVRGQAYFDSRKA